MIISELVVELEKLKLQYGDLPIQMIFWGAYGGCEQEDVYMIEYTDKDIDGKGNYVYKGIPHINIR